jgi:hypothetical protein
MASPSLESLLATLATSDVELIVVGMLAAVAEGAPVTTHDLDIVHRRTPDNVWHCSRRGLVLRRNLASQLTHPYHGAWREHCC